MIAGFTIYEACYLFLLYAFIGWGVEVVYQAVKRGKIINRGFLCGPVCPVYGFGMLAVFAGVHALESALPDLSLENEASFRAILIVFAGGMILTTAIEFLAGFLLDLLFHTRWWDYSMKPFNIHGYVCLEFSMIWGLAVVLVVRVIQPVIMRSGVSMVPERYGKWILAVLYAALLADLIVTVLAVTGLNRQLKELEELRQAMRAPSDRLSREIGGRTLKTAQAVGEARVQTALAKAELRDAAQEKAEEVYARQARMKAEIRRKLAETGRFFGPSRLLRAFPGMRHRDYSEVLKELLESLR